MPYLTVHSKKAVRILRARPILALPLRNQINTLALSAPTMSIRCSPVTFAQRATPHTRDQFDLCDNGFVASLNTESTHEFFHATSEKLVFLPIHCPRQCWSCIAGNPGCILASHRVCESKVQVRNFPNSFLG